MKRLYVVLLSALLVAFLARVDTARAGTRQGIGLGFGIGAMSGDDEAYLGIGSDLYPEVQLAYDVGAAKVGLHVGYIWRKETTDTWSGRNYSHEESELTFVPIELDVCFLPLRLVGTGDMSFQPYVGIGVGMLAWEISNYDSPEDKSDPVIMPVVRAGVEFYLGEWNVIGLDLAYHKVDATFDDPSEEQDYSFATLTLQYRFRVPIVRRGN